MDTANYDTQASSSFTEQALVTLDHTLQIARQVTGVLGLPEDAYYAVLSGLLPSLLEELRTSESSADEETRPTPLPVSPEERPPEV